MSILNNNSNKLSEKTEINKKIQHQYSITLTDIRKFMESDGKDVESLAKLKNVWGGTAKLSEVYEKQLTNLTDVRNNENIEKFANEEYFKRDENENTDKKNITYNDELKTNELKTEDETDELGFIKTNEEDTEKYTLVDLVKDKKRKKVKNDSLKFLPIDENNNIIHPSEIKIETTNIDDFLLKKRKPKVIKETFFTKLKRLFGF